MTFTRRDGVVATIMLLLGASLSAPLQAQDAEQVGALTLRGAAVLALERNPSVRAATAAVDESEARVGQALADRLPQLGLQATATEFQEPMVAAPLHAFDPTRPPLFDRTLVQGQLQLNYTVFDGGARGARIRGARASAAAADAHLDAAQMDLIAAVAHAYLGVLSASDVLEASDTSLTALSAEQDRVAQFLSEGRAAQVDLLRVEAAMAQAEAHRAAASAQLEAAEHTLARLIGVDETRAGRLTHVQMRSPNPPPARDSLLARLEAADPTIAEAAGQVDAARANRSAARSAWLPALQLVGGYLTYGTGAGDITAEWQAGLRLQYALFTGGARTRSITAADARERMAEDRLELTRMQSADRLDHALTQVRALGARANATARAVDHLQEVVRIEHLSLESGAGTQTDFLQAEAQLRTAQSDLAEARYAHIGAMVDLARATGDLTIAWLDHTLENTP